MRNIVEIKEVFKTIDNEEILSGINLQISEGEIYGFLGPNGAGKTTLMKCMLSLSTITSGSIEIFGKKLQENREEILSQIGSIIESPIFYDNCTAKEILEMHTQYMGKTVIESDIIRALRMVGLKNTSKKVKDFSLGMRQRLALARAFLTKPKLLILDEPINGLDPIGIQEIRNLLLSLSKEHGITILISSHILSEISQIADKIGFIKNGEMVEQVSMKEIRRENIDLEEYFMSHFLNEIKNYEVD
ncbi:ATP-binding cassette domain-containing protein [Streptococcus sp. S2(2023)]|uniref:ATP-binding cassette domain-containing protein n=1 Tax=Streptococcus gingivalis TaxID=3111861 RepID=A0ABU6B6V6_9STRE|nr:MULTISPECIES: ATP-binding cassette domain-containing protein [Streptococcus]MEB3519577.1 ATP-binding cassette domain-containing protein [Streptococcus sp. S2(2023)]MTS08300.1 ATP-binding cassette domain-containing protein [Streptococcus parasanguinis]